MVPVRHPHVPPLGQAVIHRDTGAVRRRCRPLCRVHPGIHPIHQPHLGFPQIVHGHLVELGGMQFHRQRTAPVIQPKIPDIAQPRIPGRFLESGQRLRPKTARSVARQIPQLLQIRQGQAPASSRSQADYVAVGRAPPDMEPRCPLASKQRMAVVPDAGHRRNGCQGRPRAFQKDPRYLNHHSVLGNVRPLAKYINRQRGSAVKRQPLYRFQLVEQLHQSGLLLRVPNHPRSRHPKPGPLRRTAHVDNAAKTPLHSALRHPTGFSGKRQARMADAAAPQRGTGGRVVPHFASAYRVDQSVQAVLAFPAASTFPFGPEQGISLGTQRVVHKTVVVHVQGQRACRTVGQETHTPMRTQAFRPNPIDFGACCIVHVGIEAQVAPALLGEAFCPVRQHFGLEQFHVDLARHAFVAIDHTANALGQLDGFDPRSGNKGQPLIGQHTAHQRNHFGLDLGVFSRQTKELNLPGSRDRVRERCVHAGVGFKTFGQIAARRLAQLSLPNDRLQPRILVLDGGRRTALNDLGLLQFAPSSGRIGLPIKQRGDPQENPQG